MFINKLKVLNKIFAANPKVALVPKLSKSQKAADMNGSNEPCSKIVWMDLEMTGLDVRKDKIMEVSCLITDKDLNILSEGPCFAIRQPLEILEQMGSWCKKHHAQSGLTQMCLESQITMEMAENILLEYLQKNVPKGKVPLAGNSIYMDRLFIRDQLPRVDDYLHYRVIDVSTVKELARRWNPQILKSAPQKAFKHRSLEDIKDSIAELQYYRQHFFKNC